MTADVAKHAAAMAALRFVAPDAVLGVGSGTTVDHFLDALEQWPQRPRGAVAASRGTELRLCLLRIPVIPLGTADLPIPLYVDGADEVDLYGRAIKGGGGAHWREKLVAGASQMWVCIVDDSKLVDRLGTHSPVPLEVEFSDLDSVEASVRDLGGRSVLREGALTDSGNPILDVHDLDLMDPHAMELDLETIPGVLASGIFAARRADLIVVGREDGSSYTLEPKPL